MSERLPGDKPQPGELDREVGWFCVATLGAVVYYIVPLLVVGVVFLLRGEILYGLPWLAVVGLIVVRWLRVERRLDRECTEEDLAAQHKRHHHRKHRSRPPEAGSE